MSGLWGEEFELPKTQDVVKAVKAKTENKKKERTEEQIMRARAVSIDEKLAVITRNVYRVLGSYASNTQVIYDYEELKSFIDKAIEKGSIAIDTETNNTLDTTTCKIMGLCLYIDGEKNTYIPVNHVDPHTKEKLPNQITEAQIREQLSRLDNTFTIFHNYQFDYKVIGFTCGIWMHADWDTSIGAKILNENEEAKLKVQYVTHIDPSIERYNINSFFENIQYELVDPKVFSLYAATDAYMTYKLYLYQKELFEQDDNHELYNLFKTVEMPISRVAANMERVGVCIDKEYASRLEESYNRRIEEVDREVDAELKHLEPRIAQWRLTPEANKKPKKAKATKDGNEFGKSKNEQLSDPVKVSSPSQLAILIYDVLQYKPVDKDKPRSTDSDALVELSKQGFKLGDIILKRRGLVKLLNTYITAIPNQVSPRDNRLHAGFNTLGTDTGRYSSSNPNLQNIPSHEKTIRLMFTASPGYTLVGGDFSQQEPRLLSSMSGDKQLIEAYNNKRDLYATIAAKIYKNDYWDNMEVHEDGTPNPEGKKRRGSVKTIVLGIMYGMGADSLSVSLKCTKEEAQKLIDDFFAGYPTVHKFIEESNSFARKNGYVDGIMGRRRRLPDILLPKYSIKRNGASELFNPILGTDKISEKREDSIVKKYKDKVAKSKGWREVKEITEEAKKDGVVISSNGGFISRAERQAVNSKIQGGAATITKLAMLNIDKDEELNKLGFRTLICVHD